MRKDKLIINTIQSARQKATKTFDLPSQYNYLFGRCQGQRRGRLVQSRCRPEYMLTDSMLQALDQCEPQIIIKVANIVRFAGNIGLFFLAANDTVLLYMLMRSQ